MKATVSVKRVKVEKCHECPFCEDGRRAGLLCSLGRKIIALPDPKAPPPDWCPLRKAQVVVTLKENA